MPLPSDRDPVCLLECHMFAGADACTKRCHHVAAAAARRRDPLHNLRALRRVMLAAQSGHSTPQVGEYVPDLALIAPDEQERAALQAQLATLPLPEGVRVAVWTQAELDAALAKLRKGQDRD